MKRHIMFVAAIVFLHSAAFAQQSASQKFTAFVKTTELPGKIQQKVVDADISKDSCKPAKPRTTIRSFKARKLSDAKFAVSGRVRMEICSTWFDDDQTMTLSGVADTQTCILKIDEVRFSDGFMNTANAILGAVTGAKSDDHDISDDAHDGKCEHYFKPEYLSNN